MKRRAFYQQHIGTVRPVLLEHHRDAALLSGFTDNYIKIQIPVEGGGLNEIKPVSLQKLSADGEVVVANLPVVALT